MKKTTQELLKFAFERMDYQERTLKIGDYKITYFYGGSEIEKERKKIGVVVEGEVYINSFFERFLFGRQVEKNLSNIIDFLKGSLGRMGTEKAELQEKVNHFKNKALELEDKLAQSVAEKVDLDLNQTD